MNREKAKKLLPVIQAWAEGEAIQVRRADSTNNDWIDFKVGPDGEGNPAFETDFWDWRVKPKIETRWVVRTGTWSIHHSSYVDRQDAIGVSSKINPGVEDPAQFVHEISWEE